MTMIKNVYLNKNILKTIAWEPENVEYIMTYIMTMTVDPEERGRSLT